MHPYLKATSDKPSKKQFLGMIWQKLTRNLKLQAASDKHQAASKAASDKPQAPSEFKYKPQASSDKQQASSHLNPSLTSAKILAPGNNLQEA
jgi:hypothetical protein